MPRNVAARADHHSPREEAGEFDFKDFDPRQQEAFKGLLGKLIGHALTEKKNGNLERKAPPAIDVFDAMVQVQRPQERLNRAYFLHGERGTGKSTVLVTLLAFFADDARKRGRNESRELRADFKDIPGYTEWFASGPPILPLPILDFSSDAVALNLPVVIGQNLARIVEALEQAHGKVGVRSFEVLPSRKALDDFHQSAVLVKRDLLAAPSVEYDAVLEREHSRISIGQKFAALTSAIAADFFQRYATRPTFVCTIDDFDLTNNSLNEVIAWIREFSSPTVYWLLAGDIERVRGDITRELYQKKLFGTEMDRHHLVPNMGASIFALREATLEKCVPYSHRERLENVPFEKLGIGAECPAIYEALSIWQPRGIPFRMAADLGELIRGRTELDQETKIELVKFFAERLCQQDNERRLFLEDTKSAFDDLKISAGASDVGRPNPSYFGFVYQVKSDPNFAYASKGQPIQSSIGALVMILRGSPSEVQIPILELRRDFNSIGSLFAVTQPYPFIAQNLTTLSVLAEPSRNPEEEKRKLVNFLFELRRVYGKVALKECFGQIEGVATDSDFKEWVKNIHLEIIYKYKDHLET